MGSTVTIYTELNFNFFFFLLFTFVCMDVWRPEVGIQCLLLLFNISIIIIIIIIIILVFFFKTGFSCEALAVLELSC